MTATPEPFINVLFFAQVRQITGCEQSRVAASDSMSQDVFWSLLIKARPELAAFQKTARLARREEYLAKDEVLSPGDEIAIIPPVSGG